MGYSMEKEVIKLKAEIQENHAHLCSETETFSYATHMMAGASRWSAHRMTEVFS